MTVSSWRRDASTCLGGPIPTPFDIVVARDGERVVLSLFGELDLVTAPQLEAHLEAAIRQGGNPLVVDVSALTFMDSSGLQVLLQTHDRTRRLDQRLVIVNGSPAVERIFELTDTYRVLAVVQRLEEV